VLAAVPKSAHPGALAAMREIFNAEDIDRAQVAIKAFEVDYGAKYPKAVAKIVDDAEVLLEFYKYPAEHWIHLRTTNPIESTFATVRLRTKVTKGPGSRAAGIAMAYKLIDAAQARWRAVNAPHLVALVRAGAVFHKALSSVPGTPRSPTPNPAKPTSPESRWRSGRVGCVWVGACDGLPTCPRAVAAARAPRADPPAVHLARCTRRIYYSVKPATLSSSTMCSPSRCGPAAGSAGRGRARR
jgi:hypothetical protein